MTEKLSRRGLLGLFASIGAVAHTSRRLLARCGAGGRMAYLLASAALLLAACNRNYDAEPGAKRTLFGSMRGDGWASRASVAVWTDPKTGCGYVIASMPAQTGIAVTPEIGFDGRPVCGAANADIALPRQSDHNP